MNFDTQRIEVASETALVHMLVCWWQALGCPQRRGVTAFASPPQNGWAGMPGAALQHFGGMLGPDSADEPFQRSDVAAILS